MLYHWVNTQDIEIAYNGWQKYEAVPVAQWIARWTSNPKVPGSNPGGDASIFLHTLQTAVNNQKLVKLK